MFVSRDLLSLKGTSYKRVRPYIHSILVSMMKSLRYQSHLDLEIGQPIEIVNERVRRAILASWGGGG